MKNYCFLGESPSSTRCSRSPSVIVWPFHVTWQGSEHVLMLCLSIYPAILWFKATPPPLVGGSLYSQGGNELFTDERRQEGGHSLLRSNAALVAASPLHLLDLMIRLLNPLPVAVWLSSCHGGKWSFWPDLISSRISFLPFKSCLHLR